MKNDTVTSSDALLYSYILFGFDQNRPQETCLLKYLDRIKTFFDMNLIHSMKRVAHPYLDVHVRDIVGLI